MFRYLLRSDRPPIDYELRSGANTIGRSPSNHLRISDPSVSGFHAEVSILDEGGRVMVRDLQSTNGTFVSGQPVEESVIQPGQILQLGSVEMRFTAEEFSIRIPEPSALRAEETVLGGAVLPDGTPACSRNPSLPATHQPSEGCKAVVPCPGLFNVASLRSLKLSGGTAGRMLFCPDCNAKCEPIPGLGDKRHQKTGLLARLTQTVRLGFGRK